MKKNLKKLIAFLLGVVMLFSVFAITACTSPPSTIIPYIGDNGNWWVDGTDTGIQAQGPAGENGVSPVITIDEKTGHLVVNGVDTGYKVVGDDGHTPVIEIGPNGNWFVDGADTGKKAQGEPGADGSDAVMDIDFAISDDWYLIINGVKTEIFIGTVLPLRNAILNTQVYNDTLTWTTQLTAETAEFKVSAYAKNGSGEKGELAASSTVLKGTGSSLSFNLKELEVAEGSYVIEVAYEGEAEEGARLGVKSAEKEWNYSIPKEPAITEAAIANGVVSWTVSLLPEGTEFKVEIFKNNQGAPGAKVAGGTAVKGKSNTVSFEPAAVFKPAAVDKYWVLVSYEGNTAGNGYILTNTATAPLEWTPTPIKNGTVTNNVVSWQTELAAGGVFKFKVYVNNAGVIGDQKASDTTDKTSFDLSVIKGQLSAGDYFIVLMYNGEECAVLNWTVTPVIIRDVKISGNIISWETDWPVGTVFTLEVWNSAGTSRVASTQIEKGTNKTSQFPGRTALDIKTLKDGSGRDLTATSYTIKIIYESAVIFQQVWVCPT